MKYTILYIDVSSTAMWIRMYYGRTKSEYNEKQWNFPAVVPSSAESKVHAESKNVNSLIKIIESYNP